jgi:hypothetical protein
MGISSLTLFLILTLFIKSSIKHPQTAIELLVKPLSVCKIVKLQLAAKIGSAASDSAARLCRWQSAPLITSKKSA